MGVSTVETQLKGTIMNWEWIAIFGFVIFGAAGIAGGIVAFRGSSRTGIRALAAASIAGGVMMWMVVLWVVPASISSTEPGGPVLEGSGFAAESLAK